MKPKLILCLALILSGGLVNSVNNVQADEIATDSSTNLSDVKIVSPQGSVDLPKLGQAIFREHSSFFSLQVPVGSRENGKEIDINSPVVQVWLLKIDGTAISQIHKPSQITIGSIGNYSTDYMYYQFSKVPINELAGVVVSINGKLYCQGLKKTNQP